MFVSLKYLFSLPSGFALVLGNRNFAWNQALAFGYDVLVSNTLIIGSAFFCLCLCMGEMTSALPFSGGIFGFVRAATGPYYGFMVACLEVIFCLSYQITITYVCVMIITYAASLESSYTPNLIFIVYGFNFFLNLLGGKPFWIVVCLAGFTTFFLLLCFLFGTLVDVNKSNINFIDYCKTNKPVTFEALMQERLTVISQFQGLQYLPLLSEYTVEPRKSIPRAMMFCATEFLTFSIFVALAACSTFPGQMILQMVPTPLVFGYQHIFKIDLVKSVWLHFPGIFAPTLTFLYCTGRQLYMIAKSGFLPSFFAYTTPETGTPIVTLTLGTLIGSGMNLLIYYYPDYMQVITFVLILSCHIVFINAFVAYLFFRKKYVSLPRSFTSPLGVWGAYYGIGNNFLGFISIFKYSSRTSALLALYILLIFLASVTIFYWVYLVKHQKFSEEEKKLMFKAYLINGEIFTI